MNKIEEPAREGFLYHLWLDRQFVQNRLRTVDGMDVEICEKGIRNYDAGPDFLNALLRINTELLRGDVEIHPIAGDWYAHGHHRDPRYNNVVLHLVTMDCPATFRTVRADGSLVPTLNLDDYLEKTAEELEVEKEIVEPKESRLCALSQADEPIIRQVVEKAGEARFHIKKKRFVEQRQNDSWDHIVYQAVLEALGYAKNQIPFRQLAENLPIETLWSLLWNDPPDLAQTKCEAYLFGAAGLLPSQQAARETVLSPGVKSYVELLEGYWRQFPMQAKIDILNPGAWQFFRLRPVNFPTRRLAAAATIVVRFLSDGFVGSFEKALTDGMNQPQKIYRELESLFVIPSHPYWSDHFSFEESGGERRGAKEVCLLGPDRARDIVVNVVLPALNGYFAETGDYRLENVVLEVLKSYPLLIDNEVTRGMCLRLFQTAKRPDLLTGAALQQGLLHLYKEMCQPDACRVCLTFYGPRETL